MPYELSQCSLRRSRAGAAAVAVPWPRPISIVGTGPEWWPTMCQPVPERTKLLVAISWPLARISRHTTMAKPRAAHHPFADAVHAGRLGMAEDAAPALQDVGPLMQRRLAGMQADHGAGRRPDVLHRGVIAVVEGAIEGTVGGQHRFALLIVEVRQKRWRAGRAARHSTVETPLLRE